MCIFMLKTLGQCFRAKEAIYHIIYMGFFNYEIFNSINEYLFTVQIIM